MASRLAISTEGSLHYSHAPGCLWLQDGAHPATLLQTNINYSQEKHRCEYLHSKLAHIKRLIAEYDQRQLQAWP